MSLLPEDRPFIGLVTVENCKVPETLQQFGFYASFCWQTHEEDVKAICAQLKKHLFDSGGLYLLEIEHNLDIPAFSRLPTGLAKWFFKRTLNRDNEKLIAGGHKPDFIIESLKLNFNRGMFALNIVFSQDQMHLLARKNSPL